MTLLWNISGKEDLLPPQSLPGCNRPIQILNSGIPIIWKPALTGLPEAIVKYILSVSNNMIKDWKNSRGLMSEGDGQIVRVLRPDEMEALLANIDVSDEKGKMSRKWLRNKGITSEDVQVWLKTALFTGCRFGELTVIHQDPTLLFEERKLRIPNYSGAKRKRKTKFRNIPLSKMGAEVLPKFFEASQMPSEEKKDVNQTLVSFTSILHASAEKIGLPKYNFTLEIATGPWLKDERGKEYRNTKPKPYTTDGVCFRSFRKTWESWLMLTFAKDYTSHMKLATAMGHDIETSQRYYTKMLSGFDMEDRQSIKPWVEGYELVE